MPYNPTVWKDYPDLTTPINASRLNNIEVGIVSSYVTGSGLLTTADFAAAAVAPSRIASVLARKVTSKAVNTTVAETDLLNAEFTLAASALPSSSCLRLTMWGDFVNNEGNAHAVPRFKFKLGSTVLIDTNTPGATNAGPIATRYGWRALVEVINLGVTNAQVVNLSMVLAYAGATGTAAGANAATGEGVTSNFGGIGSSLLHSEIVNTATIDTTASQAVVFSVINGFSASTYETKLLAALLEVSG